MEIVNTTYPQALMDISNIDPRVFMIVAISIAAISIVITIAIALYFQWWRNRKRLSYTVLSSTNLLTQSLSEKLSDSLEVKFKGEPVVNARFILVKIINDGYQSIKAEDFKTPVKIEFPEDVRILLAERDEMFPEDFRPTMNYTPRYLQIEPELFNKGDYIQIRVIIDTANDEFKVTGRIEGVSQIKPIKQKFGPLIVLIIAFLFSTSVSLGGVLLISYGIRPPFGAVGAIVLSVLPVIIFVFAAHKMFLSTIEKYKE